MHNETGEGPSSCAMILFVLFFRFLLKIWVSYSQARIKIFGARGYQAFEDPVVQTRGGGGGGRVVQIQTITNLNFRITRIHYNCMRHFLWDTVYMSKNI